MEYTTSSENIYFLNDKNIAPGVDNACPAGFNAVPSQSAFVEKYEELTGYDDRLCSYIRDEVDQAARAARSDIDSLSGKVGDVSAAVSSDYLPKAGGEVQALGIAGDLTVGGGISSRYFQTNGIGTTTFSGEENHGGVKFDFEHGPQDISVDSAGTTLDQFVKTEVGTSSAAAVQIAAAYADGRINELSGAAGATLAAAVAGLSASAKSARTGMMLDMLGQSDGVVFVGDRAIISDDIPLLPESKVENLVLKYETKQAVSDAKYVKSPQLRLERHEDDKNHIYLVDHEHLISSQIDCSDFVKDGMVEGVELRDYGDGYLPENGPYIVITWNVDGESQLGRRQTWLPVKRLFNVYRSTDAAGGLSVEGYNVYLNYDVVAKTEQVEPLQGYVSQLSGTGGVVWELSAQLSALGVQNARQLKLDGHIVHVEEGDSLKQLIRNAGDVAVENLVRNNSLFEVRFGEPSLSALSCSFTTSDGFKLGNRDLVLVHDCDASRTSIQLDDLNTDNVTIIHGGVSRYEFEAEIADRAAADEYISGEVDLKTYQSDFELSVGGLTGMIEAHATNTDNPHAVTAP